MYENTKYIIKNIIDHLGPQFEVQVFWIEENQYEKIFFNDEWLEEDKLIYRLDDLYMQCHNKTKTDIYEKKNKIDSLKEKFCKVE
jgi:hypothetical protein